MLIRKGRRAPCRTNRERRSASNRYPLAPPISTCCAQTAKKPAGTYYEGLKNGGRSEQAEEAATDMRLIFRASWSRQKPTKLHTKKPQKLDPMKKPMTSSSDSPFRDY